MGAYCILIVFIIYGHLVCGTFAQPIFYQEICSEGNYINNSAYQDNIHFLLSSYPSFGSDPDAVHGAYQCRGDLKPEDCEKCFDVATDDIKKNRRCPNSKQAILWYDTCNLRYTNELFFSVLLQKPVLSIVNQTSVTENQDELNKTLVGLMDRLVRESTVFGQSTKSFAVGEANLSVSTLQIYGLVQCADISSSNCNKCLSRVARNLSVCCNGKVGARVLNPSCNLRYEIYPFYESNGNCNGWTISNTKREKNELPINIIIIGIVLSVVASVLCTIAIWCILCSQKASKEPKQLHPQRVTNTEIKQLDSEGLQVSK
ncbi:hypothetical protein MKX01_007599 [Papaver californicum]|nr:hypothetical protein MKX01_007599 [Papaver californicum]